MSQTIENEQIQPGQGAPNFLQNLPFTGFYFGLFNRYMSFLSETQQIVMRANQGFLQAIGLPTNEDLARVNRQLFETSLRLDELETKLTDLEVNRPQV